MKRPRLAAAVAAVLGCALVSACSGGGSGGTAPSATAGGTRPAFTTVTPGVLTIATEVGNPGWMDGTDPEHLTGGVEYRMALQLAQDWGIPKVVFRNVSFTPLVSGTVTGYDLGLMTIFKTAAREQVNRYSDCYYPAITGALVRKDVTLATAADAKKLRWGYVTGGYAGLIMQKLAPATTAKSYQDGPTEYAALQSGQLDAVMDDLSSLAGRSQQAGFENTRVAAVIEGKDVPIPCSAARLPENAPAANVAAVNAELAALKPQIDGWVHQYLSPLGDDPAKYPTITVG
ncbi:substrate-binding periplasmic protein [Nocardia sp. alder85J]|uniref:substrate-binding periplasmic protein n=1 Tax=Nocardia sp. alder85J TaxID=2862949 RepID=UPI001CD352F3|nr:transporter substrate-binding domain-containing protein [Nocardia sp. alder85J]MCX4097116.1 transporter substrate-binding domain-containing protein [Nocardia sp. alder85J]